MNNSNNNLKKEFNLVTNMKMYFQKNIGQIIQINNEESQVEIISKSDPFFLPDLKSMIFNLVDLENDNLYELNNILPIQNLNYEPSSIDSECEEF
ncbi:unnamed protein product [Paramecium sonneborni]|uniref:Uncharacterized protein n=1 Tax=Paramecium sonneborni TaxID=65129 RepID=A0A8S1QNY1_9CILI|nr:unnamed protein product [Paramecium sonneborni]